MIPTQCPPAAPSPAVQGTPNVSEVTLKGLATQQQPEDGPVGGMTLLAHGDIHGA